MHHNLKEIKELLIEDGLAQNLSDENMKIAYKYKIRCLIIKKTDEITGNKIPEKEIANIAFKLSIINPEAHAYLSDESPVDARSTREYIRRENIKNIEIDMTRNNLRESYVLEHFFSSWSSLVKATRKDKIDKSLPFLNKLNFDQRLYHFKSIAHGLSGSESAYIIWHFNLLNHDQTRKEGYTISESKNT